MSATGRIVDEPPINYGCDVNSDVPDNNQKTIIMKPSTIFTLALLVGGAFVLPWFMEGKMGLAGKDDAEERARREASTISSEKTRQTFYKWQDAQGKWHMGDQVPEGVKAIPVNVDTAANVIRSVEVPAPGDESGSGSGKKAKVLLVPDTSKANPLMPITDPGAVTELVDQAKGVQDMLNERTKQLDSMAQ